MIAIATPERTTYAKMIKKLNKGGRQQKLVGAVGKFVQPPYARKAHMQYRAG